MTDMSCMPINFWVVNCWRQFDGLKHVESSAMLQFLQSTLNMLLCMIGDGGDTSGVGDHAKYPSIKLSYSAGRAGGTMMVVLSAANEKAVELFLEERIGYLDIVKVIELTCAKHREELVLKPSLEEILHDDGWAREYATQLIGSGRSRSSLIA